ncbi:urease accessory protein UreF [Pseudooceanicola nitratireducens]|uniref:urease accessory protein UreF n=1 Tax=Pseudooceanicola nitratireducens TaxID=517719 RepID=UPI001C94AEA7|nr:urease accessory protein UreF [Pseudooceanicola nitratireducens]MBY6165202.1 urease accessory protein UreF [Pseudooceanicola nitratireducens]
MTSDTAVTDPALILHQWLSPAFPVGAFSYSHGLETAVASDQIRDAASTRDWIEDALQHGAGQADAILLAAAWHAPDRDAPDEDLAELARALAPSAERLLEADRMGAAFAGAVRALYGIDMADAPYPVAFGRAARALNLPLPLCLTLFVQAFVANLVSAAVRLVPLGQTDGQRITHALSPLIAQVATRAQPGEVDQIGSAAFAVDITSMRHETLVTRLFQS